MLIGIAGKARVGNDTVANILVNEYGFTKLAFANALKEYAAKYFKIPREEMWGEKTEYSRKTLQGLGQFVRDNVSENFWTNIVWRYIQEHGADAKIVVSDVRYLSEAQFIRKNKGLLIKIIRPGTQIEAGEDHQSEIEVDKIHEDNTIFNNGTHAQLKEMTDHVMDALGLGA